jgi:UDP-N-acetylmuramyl pentapeptide synthase
MRPGPADVLWSPEDLEIVTGGAWLIRPGGRWSPANVRAPVQGWTDDVYPEWLPRGIVFVRTEAQLKKWFASERPPARPATGCVVVGRELRGSAYLPEHRAVLVVPDFAKALRALARAARMRSRGKVILVTGTVGKTTTRSMIAHCLRRQGNVVTNVGNYNLRSYVYQYMASAPASTDFAVFEVGLGGAKDAFREVAAVLRPDVVVLTQLDIAHMDVVTRAKLTREDALLALAEQKLQLTEGLSASGCVVLNEHVEPFDEIRRRTEGRGMRVVSFGESPGADTRLLAADMNGRGTNVSVCIAGDHLSFSLQVPGRFMALNALAALTAAEVAGGDVTKAAMALPGFEAISGRAQVIDLTIGGAHIKLIDDSFNATPLSMRSTFQLLESLAPSGGGRRIAILGDIAHLGENSAAIHAGLARDAVACGIERVHTLGQQMLHLYRALPPSIAAGHHASRKELVAAVLASLRDGDVLTVKASVPSGFGMVVQELKKAADPSPGTGDRER